MDKKIENTKHCWHHLVPILWSLNKNNAFLPALVVMVSFQLNSLCFRNELLCPPGLDMGRGEERAERATLAACAVFSIPTQFPSYVHKYTNRACLFTQTISTRHTPNFCPHLCPTFTCPQGTFLHEHIFQDCCMSCTSSHAARAVPP